jgi:hypothetical protein
MNPEGGINPELSVELFSPKNLEMLSGLLAIAFCFWVVRTFKKFRTRERELLKERMEAGGRSSLFESRKGDLRRRLLLKRTFQGESLRLVPQVEPLIQTLDLLVLSIRSLYGWISIPRPVLLASRSSSTRNAAVGAPQALRRLEQSLAESYEYCLLCLEKEELESEFEPAVHKILEVQGALEALEQRMEAGHASHRPVPLEDVMASLQAQNRDVELFFSKRPKIRP